MAGSFILIFVDEKLIRKVFLEGSQQTYGSFVVLDSIPTLMYCKSQLIVTLGLEKVPESLNLINNDDAFEARWSRGMISA